VGGYARANELTATSFLADEFGIQRLSITVPGEGGYLQRMWTDLHRTRACLRATRAPIFHLTSQYQRGTYREWAQFWIARQARRKFVLDIRAGNFVESYASNRFQRPLLRDMLQRAAAVTVEGRPYIDWIEREFDREAVWFPNFVQMRHRARYPRAPLERPAAGEPFRIAYSGRLVSGKGLEELVEACGQLRRESGLALQLELAGPAEGGYDVPLRRLASQTQPGSVVFHGKLEHDALLRLLASAHVFAFPTRWSGEGHSNAVNEAMQVGLPVVTTNQGFLPDVVTPACGVRIHHLTPTSLAEALKKLLGDWERLRACGEAAHQRVYREFSDEVVLRRLAELYRGLLGEDR